VNTQRMRIGIWLLVFALAGCAPPPQRPPESLTIGALLPLTGSLASYGESSRAALAEAVATINARGGPRLTLEVEDTKTDPAAALAALQKLAVRGIKLTVGPYASSEVKAAKEFADNRGVIPISPLSTARALAIADDNVFRFTPDDEQEAAAVAALAIADGVRVMLTAGRDDEGDQGLQLAFHRAFEERGGRGLPGVT
jgi:branched-chain amino acid transport system substrate-binding protein